MKNVLLIVALLLLPVSLEAAPSCLNGSCSIAPRAVRTTRVARSARPTRRAFGIFRARRCR